MLNPRQRQAIETTEGRILVLAGAGSGKTSVIVHRIAHLIQAKGTPADSILGLTFTNKAAAEMRERLARLLPKEVAKKVHLSTFHSFCMQLLRKEIHHLGYTRNFSLYDQRDSQRILKQIARNVLEHEGELPSLEKVAHEISMAKSRSTLPDNPMAKLLYGRLQTSMQAFNAVDFDSLLSLTVQLFQDHPDILSKYQEQFHYIMIDEYQDTSPVQYEIAKSLSANHHNLCVVGDDDQSIYGWRGAEIKNILTFESTHIIKLEQNYRSQPTILRAANALIRHNNERHDKELFSNGAESTPITLFHAPTDVDEATAVIQRLLHLKRVHHLRWSDFAILYRSNALSRPFEMALMQATWQKEGKWEQGIPYQVFGGLEICERSEIKDLMAYLRLIANPQDEEALLRIINVPRRGISDQTLSILTEENRKKEIPLIELMEKLHSHPQLQDRAIGAIHLFLSQIEEARENFSRLPLHEALSLFIEKISYKKAIEEEVKSEAMRAFKWENVTSCISALQAYEKEGNSPSLENFLSETMLDRHRLPTQDLGRDQDQISLMTIHSAKGLEFTSIFLTCLEDQVIPHERSLSENGLEEERRLMYVAITRAKRFLTLSMSCNRKKYGKEQKTSPSRFLLEIPQDLFQIVSWKNPFS